MTAPVLKKTLADGEAFFSSDYGEKGVTLYEFLKNNTKQGTTVSAQQATIATGVIFRFKAPTDGVLGAFAISANVCGTAGATTVVVKKNTVAVTGVTLTIDNADADAISLTLDTSALAGAPYVAGDVFAIEVTAAPTGGTGLSALLTLQPASVQVG